MARKENDTTKGRSKKTRHERLSKGVRQPAASREGQSKRPELALGLKSQNREIGSRLAIGVEHREAKDELRKTLGGTKR